MTIVVITEAKTENDLAASFPAPGNKWILVRTAAEALAHSGADAYIDLDFINGRERVEILNRLLPGLVLVNAVVSTLGDIGAPFVRVNGWPGFLERTIHEVVAPRETVVLLAGLYEK